MIELILKVLRVGLFIGFYLLFWVSIYRYLFRKNKSVKKSDIEIISAAIILSFVVSTILFKIIKLIVF